MMFVTVGTTQFDELVRTIDELIGEGKIKDESIMQIGSGAYTPTNVEWFRYSDSLEKYIKKADLIISHGGSGIIFEALSKKKRLICVENKQIKDRHQIDLLKKMSDENYLIWCKHLNKLEENIKSKEKLLEWTPNKNTIAKEIHAFLEG